ncbi:hypothetical protein SAMN04490356_9404 [Streptomyces melanosporofaciens]|uniref:DUF8017 domain-containing protein n=2 Tax=Streptomyces melanosporofaciens TaxID=67327 RepID=A0A1H5CG70_STRMJ|nr:hypothetical protein SAMN04490356_9404 [Streptomyces melanosporofaciens]
MCHEPVSISQWDTHGGNGRQRDWLRVPIMSHSKIIEPIAQPPQSTRISSRRTKKTLIAAIGIGMAVALSGCNEDTGEATDKDTSAAESKAPSAGSSQSSAPSSPAGDQPAVAGWQTQTAQKHHFRYDVPAKAKKWRVFDENTALSYTDENGQPIVVMTSAANYREGGCASSPNPKAIGEAGKGQLATVGTTGGGKDGTLQENARNWAGNWGFAAYGGADHKPKIKVSEAKPWKQGGIDGYTATAQVTVTNRSSSCVPAKAIVRSIAQKLPDGTMHGWVIYADQGVPNALTAAEIEKVMGTVRSTGS